MLEGSLMWLSQLIHYGENISKPCCGSATAWL